MCTITVLLIKIQWNLCYHLENSLLNITDELMLWER